MRRGRRLEADPIDVAPVPALAGLERADDRVLRRAVVPRRVLVLRVVAAADVSAGHAETQMHPHVACLEALLASIRGLRLDAADRPEVAADGLFHLVPLVLGLALLEECRHALAGIVAPQETDERFALDPEPLRQGRGGALHGRKLDLADGVCGAPRVRE